MRSRPDHSPLAGVAAFDPYDARTLAPLTRHADRLTVPAGTTVARRGRPAREVVAVLSGEVLVMTEAGVARCGPGAWVGAAEVRARTPHDATVVAGTDLDVLVLTAPAFRWATQVLPGLLTPDSPVPCAPETVAVDTAMA
jgi:CRP-like cAMP-binding protein